MDSVEVLISKVPSVSRIHETAALARSEPGNVNLRILEGYVNISNLFGALLHGGSELVENATFPTFAAWSAESLRREVVREYGAADELPLLTRFLRPGRSVYRVAAKIVLGDDAVIGRNIAQGQGAVYEEIGTAVVTLISDVLTFLAAKPTPTRDEWSGLWTSYTDNVVRGSVSLNEGRLRQPDQPNVIAPGDVAVLLRAVEPYFELLRDCLSRWDVDETERKLRAELILLANIRLVAYEQSRLQLVLNRNLAYVPNAIRVLIGDRLLGRDTIVANVMRRLYEASDPAPAIVEEAFAIAATRHVYSMVVGAEEVVFGRDLPLPQPSNPVLRDEQPERDLRLYGVRQFFPYHLQTLHNSDLWAEWHQHDRSTGQGTRTAVNNWLRYGERLNFIVNLFRSRQQIAALYERPRSTPPPVAPQPAPLSRVSADLSDRTRELLSQRFPDLRSSVGADGGKA